MTVLEYLKQHYKNTGWFFIPVKQVLDVCGKESTVELNRLAKEGYVTKREGANFDLVEIHPEKFK